MATDPSFFDFYNNNPIGVIDQNVWTDRDAAVMMQFQTGPTIYTPLIEWTDRSSVTGAQYSQFTELLEGEADTEELTMTQQYIPEPLGVDSRMRQLTVARYGDKVQLHESDNIFQMWQMSGGRDWRPLLRGVLGSNVRRKVEALSRNAFLRGPKTFWTYGGDASSFATLDADDKFGIGIVNEWNLRIGQTGDPVIPGDMPNMKVCIVPPGAIFDFQESLHKASQNEAALWRDATIWTGRGPLPYELGTYKNIRFMQAPNDKYGQSGAVLYNGGRVVSQVVVTEEIHMGDGAPDPTTTQVDETWYVGQKGAAHQITCAGQSLAAFNVNDIISLHTEFDASLTGDPNGVALLHGKTIHRRIVAKPTPETVQFDRPVLFHYGNKISRIAKDGTVTGYCYMTKASHVGFCLVLGAKGGIKGNVNRPLRFFEPKPIDDFESVWRYVWDIIAGYNVWDPLLFECHFVSVTLPKPGGIISPMAEIS